VFEAKFMLPWSFSEEGAAEKYMAQLQHNMWVTHLRTSVLSIITGGGKWVEITIPMDPLYLSVLVSAEKKFWRSVQSGEPPHLINVRSLIPYHAQCLSRSRTGEKRAQGPNARGCQRSDRAWRARQAIESRRGEF
jgi:hypothetical protein